jgi:putative phage-type endonuclease
MDLMDIEQGSQEWKDLRKTKITATDMCAIMGVSPYDTPLSLYKRKKGEIPEKEMLPHMQRGLEIEDEIRGSFFKFDFKPAVGLHKFAMASFDGIDTEKKVVLEIKLVGTNDFNMIEAGEIPEKFKPQIQWQLYVSGYETHVLKAQLWNTDQTAEIWSSPDDRYITSLVVEGAKFHERLIFDDPPEPGPGDVEEHGTESLTFKQFQQAEQDLSRAKKAYDEAKKQLIKEVESQDPGRSRKHIFGNTTLTHVTRKGAVKYETLPGFADICDGVDLDEYRGPSSNFWTIKTKE